MFKNRKKGLKRTTTASSIPSRPKPLRAIISAGITFALIAMLFAHASLAVVQQQQQQSSPPLVAPSSTSAASSSAPRTFPKEIRGYKVARAKVEVKKPKAAKGQDQAPGSTTTDADALIQFGEPRIAKMTPLGITMEVPVTVAAVKQGGHVDFLTFEDMVVNGTSVTIEDYMRPFDLPNKQPVLLPEPVQVFISAPRALLGALGEWNSSKDVWPVTGRVYVFGRFKKFLFSFKRVVPVELNLTLPNPLKTKQTAEPAAQ